MSANKYVKEAIRNIEAQLEESGRKLKANVKSVLPSGYRPELDVSPELSRAGYLRYNSLIGTLRWAVEIGRVDICCEVSIYHHTL